MKWDDELGRRTFWMGCVCIHFVSFVPDTVISLEMFIYHSCSIHLAFLARQLCRRVQHLLFGGSTPVQVPRVGSGTGVGRGIGSVMGSGRPRASRGRPWIAPSPKCAGPSPCRATGAHGASEATEHE